MRLIFLMSHFQVSQDLDESLSSLSRLGWVTFKSLEIWMSHFQVSQDLDESLSSLSWLGWVTFKSLKTWMVTFKSLEIWMSHFQVSQDLDESLSSLSRLGWGLERRGIGILSSSVDCCYSNLLDLLRVKTRVCSYNLYATPFLSFPSHLTLVKFIKLKRTQSVCTREKEREREKRQRENKVFFWKKWTPAKIKKNK
jgi:hypothetical protein